MRDGAYGESAVSRRLRWAYRLTHAVCSSIDPKQQRADTDKHTLSRTFILFSVDLNTEEQSLAEAEAHRVALMRGVRGFLTP